MKYKILFILLFVWFKVSAQPTIQDTTRMLVFDPVKSWITTGAGIRAHALSNAFTGFTGPAISIKTFTLPNASSTILTSNDVVTVAQGGTGRSTGTTSYGLITAGTTATGAQQTLAAGTINEILVGGGASALPVWTTCSGTGLPLRQTSPTFVTPSLGTPSSGNLANCLNFPASQLAGTVAVANGGSGTASTLSGILQGGSPFTAFTSSTVGQIPRCTGTNTFAFGAVDLADSDAVTGVLPTANGGTSTTTGRATAQTAANTNVVTLTNGAADASYEVSGNALVTTSSGEIVNIKVDYTDESNTARTFNLNVTIPDGTVFTNIRFSNGATVYSTAVQHIRCKASTDIKIYTTGTFTGCTYNIEGRITKI